MPIGVTVQSSTARLLAVYKSLRFYTVHVVAALEVYFLILFNWADKSTVVLEIRLFCCRISAICCTIEL